MPITTAFNYTADLSRGAASTLLRQPLSTLDANAHTFTVEVVRGNAPASLTGARCEGWFVRADGVTVPIDGVTNGNTATVTLLPACYEVPGRFALAVKLVQGSVIHTILRAEGSIDVSRTDELTQGGTGTQSFDEIVASLDAIFEAAQSAGTDAQRAEDAAENTAADAVRAEAAAERAEAAAERAEQIGGTGTGTGTPGVSPTIDVSKSGKVTTLTITDVEGTKTATINDGADGDPGAAGVGIKSVVQTTTSTNDGGSNVMTVTKTDNSTSTFTVKNGSKGSPGKTPVKGTDYYTEADKADMVAQVKSAYAADVSWLDGYDIPKLYLTGDTTGMTKENPVTLTYTCTDAAGTEHTGSCTLKWQGSSSLAYDKKNYTIKLDTAIEMVEGWTAQKKYCLKANFIDHSHARNLVSCKLWGQIVKSRTGVDSRLTALPNAGAVDGFPCAIVLNGELHGLYTWNIPKDGWMFGMEDSETVQQAIVCGDKYTDATYFKALAELDGTDYELEYCSTSDTSWVKTSFNNMLQAVINSNGGNIDTVLAQYIDIDSAIDYLIDTVAIQAPDCVAKNTLLVTYDGTKWFFSAYDRDSTFGLHYAGKSFYGLDAEPSFSTWKYHRLMNLLWTYKREAIRTRYAEIRAAALSEANVAKNFWNFECAIPKMLLHKDVERWPSIPSTAVSDIHQILQHYRLRCAVVDEWIKSTSGELEPPASGYTNLVPTSIDTNGNIFNGTGYKDGYRMNSSGAEAVQTGSTVTGYMPCTNADTIRVTGTPFGPAAVCGVYGYVSCYDANFTKLVSTSMDNICNTYTSGTYQGITMANPTGTFTKSDIITLTFSGVASAMAYLRISSSIDANAGTQTGADLIVTKNEEIV